MQKQINRKKIPDPRNTKEHYQSFITEKKKKSVKIKSKSKVKIKEKEKLKLKVKVRLKSVKVPRL